MSYPATMPMLATCLRFSPGKAVTNKGTDHTISRVWFYKFVYGRSVETLMLICETLWKLCGRLPMNWRKSPLVLAGGTPLMGHKRKPVILRREATGCHAITAADDA